MSYPTRFAPLAATVAALSIALAFVPPARAADPAPIKPVGADGKPLNLDFEDGHAQGLDRHRRRLRRPAGQGRHRLRPARRHDAAATRATTGSAGSRSSGDDGTGTLTSVPFKVTHRWASFLVGGGPWPETRVELVSAADDKVFFKCSAATRTKTLRPVVVDLEKQAGQGDLHPPGGRAKGRVGPRQLRRLRVLRPAAARSPTSWTRPSRVGGASPEPDKVKFAGLPPEQAARGDDAAAGFQGARSSRASRTSCSRSPSRSTPAGGSGWWRG